MREKFKAPRIPSEIELEFISRLKRTHDSYGLSDDTLAIVLKVSKRDLRYYKERYNNFKYIGIVPQGKIVTVNGLYKLITPESHYAQRTILKSNYDLICAAIDYHNTRKSLGNIQAKGQLSLYDIQKMTNEELIVRANELDELLKEE